jgi:hypothetical protein
MSALEGLKKIPRRDVVVHLIGKSQVGKLATKSLLESLLHESLNIISREDASPHQNISVVIGTPPFVIQEDIGQLVLCLFDISDVDSFKVAVKLLQHLQPRQKITKVLVGNKIDLEYWRRVWVESGVELATMMNCKYCEISAHTGMHVDLLVDMVFREMFVGVGDEVLSDVLTRLRTEFQLVIENQMREIHAIAESLRSSIDEQNSYLAELDNNLDGCGRRLEKKTDRKKGSRSSSLSPSRSRRPGGESKGTSLPLSLPSAPPRVPAGPSGWGSKQEESPATSSSSSTLDFFSSLPPVAPPPSRVAPPGEPSADLWEDEFEEAQEATSPLQIDTSPSSESCVSSRQAVAVSDYLDLAVDKIMERSEKLDALEIQATDLMQQSPVFKKSATKLRRQQVVRNFCLKCVCCPCLFAVFVFESLERSLKELAKKTALLDNVLADTENAFQSLAKLLVFLKEGTWHSLSPCVSFAFGGVLNVLSGVLSFLIVLSSTILLILPSFFTLLIIRTTTVEKESKAFGGES